MTEQPRTVSVQLLDKEYTVVCPDGEEAELLASADYLDSKMREIREHGKLLGLDRIAVMAALNISHELMKLREHNRENTEVNLKRIAAKVDAALNHTNKNLSGTDLQKKSSEGV